MSDDRELETRVEQIVDSYVSAHPIPNITPLEHKIRVFSKIADIASRLHRKYDSSLTERPISPSVVADASTPQH